MKKKPGFLILFIILFAVLYSLYIFVGQQNKDGNKNKEALSFRIIPQVMQMIKQEYVEQVDATDLLNGALNGINLLCKEKKITINKYEKLITQKGVLYNTNQVKQYFNIALANAKNTFTESELIYAALNGMLFVLNEKPFNDPYTVVFIPKEFKFMTEQMNGGNFGGIGIYINLDPTNDNALTVIDPIDGTPASRAGLQPGDIISHINGEPTKGLEVDMCVQKLRGKIGSNVKITIIRKGEKNPIELKLKRELIHVRSAKGKMLKDNIGYINLRIFGQDTGKELGEELKKLQDNGARAIILDLRNNGGGYINAAVDVCSHFLPKSTLIVSVVNYRKNYRELLRSKESTKNNLQLVVLMNKYSASASEITAGAIKDNNRGILIGTTSFGKASVQSIYELPDGGAVKYTMAHYLTPNGHNISKKGIKPDIVVEMDLKIKLESPEDIQLKKAIEYLTKKPQAEKNPPK